MFRIKSIYISDHQILKNVNIDFFNMDVLNDKNIFSTVIIGRNGIGKSFLLQTIVEVFNNIYAYADGNKNLNYNYQIKFILDRDNYEISNFIDQKDIANRNTTKIMNCICNGKNIDIDKIHLPKRVVASTMTIADKFTSKSTNHYFYRGIRNENSPSTTGTRTLVRKTVENIIDSLKNKENFKEELCELLGHLGFQPRLEIRYKMRYKEIFLRSEINESTLIDIYKNQANHFEKRKTDIWGTSKFNTISQLPDNLNSIVVFLRRLTKLTEQTPPPYVAVYNVLDDYSTLSMDAKALKLLSDLDILTFPELKIYKKDENVGYEFVESSSGESQLLCQFISVMSTIRHNSLVLIDEPENSTHPNWQINYIDWLMKIFKKYSDCHFIIATHSHFMLTDLRPDSSSIIALEKDSNGLHDIADGVNTFCWSVDDILYRVFRVRNTRNRTFEINMYKLYDLLSNGKKDSKEVKDLVEELKKYKLNNDDPLIKLLKLAE